MNYHEILRSRFLALIIDSIIILPVFITGTFLVSFFDNSILKFLFSHLSETVSVFYVILMHAFYGQTLGKKILKIKVFDISGKPIIFGQAVLRSLPQIASILFTLTFSASQEPESQFALWFGIFLLVFNFADIIVCIFTEKHRALHDLIAGTLVKSV